MLLLLAIVVIIALAAILERMIPRDDTPWPHPEPDENNEHRWM